MLTTEQVTIICRDATLGVPCRYDSDEAKAFYAKQVAFAAEVAAKGGYVSIPFEAPGMDDNGIPPVPNVYGDDPEKRA